MRSTRTFGVMRLAVIAAIGGLWLTFNVRAESPVDTSDTAPAQQVAPPAEQQRPRPAAERARVVYSPWTRSCGTDKTDAAGARLCLTVTEARPKGGHYVLGATLVERGEPAVRTLRITLPGPLRPELSVVFAVDGDPPVTRQGSGCQAKLCMVDFAVDQHLASRLNSGHTLNVRIGGSRAHYAFPLWGLAAPVYGATLQAAAQALFSRRIRRIQCAGASELCAWKRIPGRR